MLESKALLKEMGHEVQLPPTEVKDEAESGGDLNRPAFKDLMNRVKNGEFDVVAVYKIDRMSRNLTHLLNVFETFQKNNVSFF